MRTFVERLLEHGTTQGHHCYYGAGNTPGMSCYYTLDGSPRSVWALYLYPTGALAAIQIGSIASGSEEAALAFVDHLRKHPKLVPHLEAISPGNVNKYPNLPIEGLLDQTDVQDHFFNALNALIKA